MTEVCARLFMGDVVYTSHPDVWAYAVPTGWIVVAPGVDPKHYIDLYLAALVLLDREVVAKGEG